MDSGGIRAFSIDASTGALHSLASGMRVGRNAATPFIRGDRLYAAQGNDFDVYLIGSDGTLTIEWTATVVNRTWAASVSVKSP